jgi:hypothetical protein
MLFNAVNENGPCGSQFCALQGCCRLLAVQSVITDARQLGHRLTPVPPHRLHRTTLSPFLSVPFPSQFLHFSFVFFCILASPAKWL